LAQLHFYIPDAIAEKIKLKADRAHLTVSKYMAELAKKEVENQWPDEYFEIFGQWQGPSLERPEQGQYELKDAFK